MNKVIEKKIATMKQNKITTHIPWSQKLNPEHFEMMLEIIVDNFMQNAMGNQVAYVVQTKLNTKQMKDAFILHRAGPHVVNQPPNPNNPFNAPHAHAHAIDYGQNYYLYNYGEYYNDYINKLKEENILQEEEDINEKLMDLQQKMGLNQIHHNKYHSKQHYPRLLNKHLHQKKKRNQ
eukprot:148128_1